MADTWIGLCRDEATADVRRALRRRDERARLVFANSPQDLRSRIQEARDGAGAIVGPLDGTLSSINIAAALVRDGMAREVVLVAPAASDDLARRARRAGITEVVDASALVAPMPDLDEPSLVEDDVPTMVWSARGLRPASARCVPEVEKAPAPQMLTLPMLRAGAHGPTVESVRVPKAELERKPSPPQQERPRTSAEGHAPILTFVSGRGGVGKTSLVAMMASVAASWGMRVAACDLDLSWGNLYACFGLRSAADLAELADEDGSSGHVAADEVGVKAAEGITLFGPCERPEMAELVFPRVEGLLGELAATYDLVLVDTSTSFTDAVAQAAQQCDRLLITVDDRPGSTSSQARVAALAVRLGVARTRMVRVANRCGPHGRGEPVLNRADVGLETARPLRVYDGGSEVAECLVQGKPADLADLGSRFAESSATALAKLLSELGRLPSSEDAHQALEDRLDRPRWAFGRRREAL